MGLNGGECELKKKNAAYYIHNNQELNDQDYENRGSCVYRHLFNDHSLCEKMQCTKLQADELTCPKTKLEKDPPEKYRGNESLLEKKLYKMVEDKVGPFLAPDKLKEVHHPFDTQKNESLKRKGIAVASKDVFLGGRMQLHDRLTYSTNIANKKKKDAAGTTPTAAAPKKAKAKAAPKKAAPKKASTKETSGKKAAADPKKKAATKKRKVPAVAKGTAPRKKPRAKKKAQSNVKDFLRETADQPKVSVTSTVSEVPAAKPKPTTARPDENAKK